MLFENITILDENLQVRENMFVVVKNGRITYIGELAPEEDFGERYAGRGRLLMSAFYNAHAHSPMSLMRGYGENMSLSAWLQERIFPFEEQMNDHDIYYATLLTMAESLRYGIVSSSESYFGVEAMTRAVLDSGAKSNMGRGMTCMDDSDMKNLQSFHEAQRLWEDYHLAADGRIRVDWCIHAEYTTTPKFVRQLAEHSASIGSRIQLHMSESRFEHEECKQRHQGLTPAQYFDRLGVFACPTLAAHCVWVEEADMEIMAEKGVAVACCPASNMKLASGVCNTPGLLQYGINVTLGTDSVASNNNLDMIEEMKLFACLPKAFFLDPLAISSRQAIQAATGNGAQAQGREDCGSLKLGYRADLIVLDFNQPHLRPVYDYADHVVYSASGSDVCLTMADGKVLYRDGIFMTIDVEKAVAEVESSRNRIIKELAEKVKVNHG